MKTYCNCPHSVTGKKKKKKEKAFLNKSVTGNIVWYWLLTGAVPQGEGKGEAPYYIQRTEKEKEKGEKSRKNEEKNNKIKKNMNQNDLMRFTNR